MVFYVCHELDKAKTPNNLPFCQYESRTKHLYSQLQTATRKASWNPAGVEPVHWKQADIDPGSLKWAKIGEYISSELMVRIKQNRVYGVETPLPRSFLGGVAQNLEIISKNFQFNTRRTRILMGFIISTMFLLGVNRKSHGQNSGTLSKFWK